MNFGWTTCDIKHQRGRGHDFGGTPPLAEIFPYNYIPLPCCRLVDNDSHYPTVSPSVRLDAWLYHYWGALKHDSGKAGKCCNVSACNGTHGFDPILVSRENPHIPSTHRKISVTSQLRINPDSRPNTPTFSRNLQISI